MIRRPPRSTRTDTSFPTRRSSDLPLTTANGQNPRTVTAPHISPVLHYPIRAMPCSLSARRSEEHTSELQSLMRISYAVFCLKKKKHKKTTTYHHTNYDTKDNDNRTAYNEL